MIDVQVGDRVIHFGKWAKVEKVYEHWDGKRLIEVTYWAQGGECRTRLFDGQWSKGK